MQLVMVTFSVARAKPKAKVLLRQMPSSLGEFTLQSLTCTLRQQSISIPSRLVSSFTLLNGEVIHPGCQNAEPPAVQYTYIAILTLRHKIKRDSFVGGLFILHIIMV
jgi:hypothetical protein